MAGVLLKQAAALGASYTLGTFNDNFFKQAALLLAVSLGYSGFQAWGTFLFALPFVLFSAWAGWLADRFPKKYLVTAAKCPYQSPTDMGVNMAGNCIINDEVCRQASRMEILRRYYTAQVDVARGIADACQLRKLELVMQQADVTPDLCPAVAAAKQKAEETGAPAGAMVLPDGRVVTGKTSSLLGASDRKSVV